MPMSNNPKTNEEATKAVALFHQVFGSHPGFRATHAKGSLLTGTFRPTSTASQLSIAPHFDQPSTRVTVRFSNATGLPSIPDTSPDGNPRGFAVRFHLGERQHTDVIAQSSPFFAVKNGTEFVEFFTAVVNNNVPDFLGGHPAAVAFLQAAKPTPKSFATATYFGLNAQKFIDAHGKETYFRYRVVPDVELQTLSEDEVKSRSDDFLFDEIHERVKDAPISFSLMAQVAEQGDVTDDCTVQWPEDRKMVKLGTIIVDGSIVENDAEKQRTLIMDPVPRVAGIEASEDPLLDFRAAVYLISGKERRAAGAHSSGENK